MFPHGGRAGAHTQACDLGMCVFGTRKPYVTKGILGITNVHKHAHVKVDVASRDRASAIVKQGVNRGGLAQAAHPFCLKTSHNFSGAKVNYNFITDFTHQLTLDSLLILYPRSALKISNGANEE